MTNNLEKQRKGIKTDISNLVEDAHALVEATSDVASEKVVEARKRLATVLESGRDAYGRVREKAFDRADALVESIHENPLAAVGIALGVGAFIGMLLIGRRSRRD